VTEKLAQIQSSLCHQETSVLFGLDLDFQPIHATAIHAFYLDGIACYFWDLLGVSFNNPMHALLTASVRSLYSILGLH
jgi:hypothetical protein